jgi:hypothetical protein
MSRPSPGACSSDLFACLRTSGQARTSKGNEPFFLGGTGQFSSRNSGKSGNGKDTVDICNTDVFITSNFIQRRDVDRLTDHR